MRHIDSMDFSHTYLCISLISRQSGKSSEMEDKTISDLSNTLMNIRSLFCFYYYFFSFQSQDQKFVQQQNKKKQKIINDIFAAHKCTIKHEATTNQAPQQMVIC